MWLFLCRRINSILLLVLLTAATMPLHSSRADDCPAVGAIRWDAWYGKGGEVGDAVERSLGPSRWHYRLPFCGRVIGKDKVEIECDSQEAMDKEIDYAVRAGITFWLFSPHRPEEPMSYALKYYLSSKYKGKIYFALRTAPGNWGGWERSEAKIDKLINLLKEPVYMKVLGGRPLFFLSLIKEEKLRASGLTAESLRRAIHKFRCKALDAGLQNPYIVVMNNSPAQSKELLKYYGFDAVSAYSNPGNGVGAPYSDLARVTARKWEQYRATGIKVVPLAMTGWDNRPRAEYTAPWQMSRKERLGKVYYKSGLPEEIAGHIADAVRWVKVNKSVAEAGVVVIYAWNENDEGGWLVPTTSEGTARVDALGRMMKSVCP